MKTLYSNIKIPTLKGDDLIKDSKLFKWIDPDFVNYKASGKGKATRNQTLEVLEMDKDATFKELFPNPEKMVMTQGQILYFVKNHRDKLKRRGFATFFLFKSNNKFFVADVNVLSSDSLDVRVYRLGDSRVWGAEYRHRVVSPQLADSSETLEFNPSDELENAIKVVKEAGYKIFKEV